MQKVLILLFAAVVVGAVLVAGASASRSATPMLTGTDGPGFTISLKMNGKAVKTLKAGTYKLVIHDKASHPRLVARRSARLREGHQSPCPFMGTKTMTLKLKAGGYKFYCPPARAEMFGRFKVK